MTDSSSSFLSAGATAAAAAWGREGEGGGPVHQVVFARALRAATALIPGLSSSSSSSSSLSAGQERRGGSSFLSSAEVGAGGGGVCAVDTSNTSRMQLINSDLVGQSFLFLCLVCFPVHTSARNGEPAGTRT